MKDHPFQQGTFFLGCNYWASRSGLWMWKKWDEQEIESDFRRLAEAGIHYLRVFPLWSDFQPLRMHRGYQTTPREIRLGEDVLPFTEAGQAGVDETMLTRFGRLCDLAQECGIRLLVSLLNGWMSGRLFLPEMLQDRNPLRDPLSVKWEIRYVRVMIRRFHTHPAILGWEPGNESNCMGPVGTPEEAYLWLSSIAMAIRTEDPVHPVFSGFSGPSADGVWRSKDQGEFMDILTTHPYPLFTVHCDTDPLNRMKSALFSAARTDYVSHLGGKAAFVEEFGVLGPMVVSDEIAADYVRAALMTQLAHDCRGMMWWCAHDQTHLASTPHDWDAVERELGLFRRDGSKKPVMEEIMRFSHFTEWLPFDSLPPAIEDAVCILTQGKDSWGVALGAFILAKQAGLKLRFAGVDDEIPEADAYILPSLEGLSPVPRHVLHQLLDRVRAGATLCLSMDGALLSPFAEFSGVRVLTRSHQPMRATATVQGVAIAVESDFSLHLQPIGAEVLARTEQEEIILTRNRFEKGCVCSLFVPIEKQAAQRPCLTDGPDARDNYRFYQAMNLRSCRHAASMDVPTVGLTEHPFDERHRALIAVNYEPYEQEAVLSLANGWHITSCFSPDNGVQAVGNTLRFARNTGAVLLIERE